MVSELELTRAEVEAVLEEGRRLGLRVWDEMGCGGSGVGIMLTVKQARRAPGAEEWSIPFELTVPLDHGWGGSAVVRHEGGHWSLLRLEYDH